MKTSHILMMGATPNNILETGGMDMTTFTPLYKLFITALICMMMVPSISLFAMEPEATPAELPTSLPVASSNFSPTASPTASPVTSQTPKDRQEAKDLDQYATYFFAIVCVIDKFLQFEEAHNGEEGTALRKFFKEWQTTLLDDVLGKMLPKSTEIDEVPNYTSNGIGVT